MGYTYFSATPTIDEINRYEESESIDEICEEIIDFFKDNPSGVGRGKLSAVRLKSKGPILAKIVLGENYKKFIHRFIVNTIHI